MRRAYLSTEDDVSVQSCPRMTISVCILIRHQDIADRTLGCAMSMPDKIYGLVRDQRKEYLEFAIERTLIPFGDGDGDGFLLMV